MADGHGQALSSQEGCFIFGSAIFAVGLIGVVVGCLPWVMGRAPLLWGQAGLLFGGIVVILGHFVGDRESYKKVMMKPAKDFEQSHGRHH